MSGRAGPGQISAATAAAACRSTSAPASARRNTRSIDGSPPRLLARRARGAARIAGRQLEHEALAQLFPVLPPRLRELRVQGSDSYYPNRHGKTASLTPVLTALELPSTLRRISLVNFETTYCDMLALEQCLPEAVHVQAQPAVQIGAFAGRRRGGVERPLLEEARHLLASAPDNALSEIDSLLAEATRLYRRPNDRSSIDALYRGLLALRLESAPRLEHEDWQILGR